MYTNFLRIAKQLWVQLPGYGWTDADYDIVIPGIGHHVSLDYTYELKDNRKLNLGANLTSAEKDHYEDVKQERANSGRAMSLQRHGEIR